jgi:uncharacterized protein
MLIGLLQVEILIPGCNSLKDKRSIIKKHLHRIRRNYNVSVAETGKNDIWRRAEISFTTVSSLKNAVERVLRQVLIELDTSQDIVVLDSKTELL